MQRSSANQSSVSATVGEPHRSAILVVDDEPGMRNFLRRTLEHECALLEVADCAESAEELRRRLHFDLLIVDIRLPGRSGIEWLEQLRADGVGTDVIFISAFADLNTAVEALRAGAADLVLKPFRTEQILTAINRCLERRAMHRENAMLKRQTGGGAPTSIVGASTAMGELEQIVARVAPTPSTVLIEGETGTGKELIARAVHAQSGRAGAFVAVNCGSIAPHLLESELFGHTKGAFTDAQQARDGLFVYASDGTLFLDEVSELPLALQPKLLRALEDHRVRPVGADQEVPVDVRVIAATNRQLDKAVSNGSFRDDLYYRLNVVSVRVPPLRERRDDLPLLANHFNETLAAELGVRALPLQHEELQRLQDYAWPGNVRELRNVIERSLLLGKLPSDGWRGNAPQTGAAAEPAGYPPDWPLAEVEKHHAQAVLAQCDGNKSAAARALGVSRRTLERKHHLWRDH